MKIVTILGTLFFLIVGIQDVWAEDVKFTIVEKRTNVPVEDVNVCWQLLQNHKKNGFGISNQKGTLQLPIPAGEKAIIAASCIGYKTLVDTVLVQKINFLKLERDIFKLEQVVVTGHSTPTPIDSSLYSVRVIDKQKIVSSGATSLGDLFFTEPNINLSSDLILGTQIEMFGMSGQNVKVMIDGVPVIGRLGGNIDLSQITVDNIDHVEIIEGPMSVVYGNNALAGTINVITDKKRYHTTEINASTDVESVGRYNGALDVAQKIGKSTLGVSGNYSKFDGVDFNKNDRPMEWKPQQQYAINGRYLLDLGKWNVAVKGSVYNNKLTIKGKIDGEYKARDAYYYTDRYTGSITTKGKLNDNNDLSILVSHSYYDHSVQQAVKDMTTLAEEKGEKVSAQSEKNTLMRTVWNHQFQPKKLSMETGLDFSLSSMSGKRVNESKDLNNYAAFLNIRYSPWDNFELQPGIRVMHNTKFDAPILYSINAKWNMAENLSWRVSAAKGYRAPNVKEMYLSFYHAGFWMLGNEDLKAEKSNSYNMSLDYDVKWKENCLKASAKLFYNDIYDMIAQTYTSAKRDTSKYYNIAQYKTRGGSLGATLFVKDFLRINASGIVTARYNRISEYKASDKFTTTLDIIAGVQVKEPRSKIQLNANIKMYGKQDFFRWDGKNVIKANLEPYEMLNVSLNRRFLSNRLNVTIGAKNLLNVKDVKMNGVPASGGGGHGASDREAIAFGTSYFAKISFKFSK